jgi:hypothetical protein
MFCQVIMDFFVFLVETKVQSELYKIIIIGWLS